MQPPTSSDESASPPEIPGTLALYRSLALPVFAPTFIMSACQSSVMLLIPLFALELGAHPGVAAVIFAIRGLGNMVIDVPAGYAASKLGDKFTMLIGIGMMIATAFAASFTQSALLLSFIAFFFGAAMAIWLLARLTFISETIAVVQRGKAVSTMAGLQRFGGLAGPVSTGVIATTFSFEVAFLCIAAFACIALTLTLVFVRKNVKVDNPESPNLLRIVPHILSNHQHTFLTAGIAVSCCTLLRASRQLLIPLWGESIGLNTNEIGYIVGCAAAVDMVMFPLAGYLMDNKGRRTTLVCCLAFLSLAIFLIPFSNSFITLLGCAMLAGFGNGLGSGINMTMGADFAPSSIRGEFLGVWRLMSDAGSFTGPLITGYIASSFMLAAAFPVSSAFGLVGICLVIFGVKETLQPKPE